MLDAARRAKLRIARSIRHGEAPPMRYGHQAALIQARVTAVDIEDRECTVTVNGTSYSNVPLADGVHPVVDTSVWIADFGSGRWLAVFTTRNRNMDELHADVDKHHCRQCGSVLEIPSC